MKKERDWRNECGATIEGPASPSGVVLWRRHCRNRKMKDFNHCRHHLSFQEREQLKEMKSEDLARPRL